jgi:hypothetical protein
MDYGHAINALEGYFVEMTGINPQEMGKICEGVFACLQR